MDLKEIMTQQTFAVLGDTLNKEKTAYEIKHKLTQKGYTVYPVGKELCSMNDIPENIDVIDLCIHPAKGLPLLKEYNKQVKAVVIQPGAESDEIIDYLKENHIPYVHGCLLLGLKVYRK
jgi:predicted CoA-binding protein